MDILPRLTNPCFLEAVPSERRDSAGVCREAFGPALAKKLIGDVQGFSKREFLLCRIFEVFLLYLSVTRGI